MKIKTQDLTGAALDWAVEEALGGDHTYRPREYSTDWSQGGPIIEQELIELSIDGASNDGMWVAKSPDWHAPASGHTPLVAAMRCYVASRLGDEVDIPEALG